ncbi:MAG: hypothetical protein V1659_01095 [Candidatus Woesearchaeota archaeon]
MNLSAIIVFLIAYLGIAAGAILCRLALEEITSGRKYFMAFQSLILLALTVMLFFAGIYLGIASLVVSAFFLWKRLDVKSYLLIYFYLSAVLFAGFLLDKMLYFSVLVFLFGLPSGTLIVFTGEKKKARFLQSLKRVLFNTSTYFIGFLFFAVYSVFFS